MKEHLPFILRAFEALFAVIAMGCIGGGFRRVQPEQGLTTQLGSSEFTFLLITTYTAWILTGGWAASMHLLNVRPPKKRTAVIFNVVFIVMLLSGGIAVAVSDYVKSCSEYNDSPSQTQFLNCGTLTAAVAFTFLLMVIFIIDLVITLMPDQFGMYRESDLYGESNTPNKA